MTPFQADAARALDEHHVAGLDQRRHERGRLVRVGGTAHVAAVPRRVVIRMLAHRHHQRDARLGRARADLAMEIVR